MLQDLMAFKKEIEKKIPPICLIIAKDPQESLDTYLGIWKKSFKLFEGESFDTAAFLGEMESFSLFDEERLVFVKDIDKIKDHTQIVRTFSHLDGKIKLLLTSTTAVLIKEVNNAQGVVLNLAEEKPWQKKKRWEALLREKLALEKVVMSSEAMHHLIENAGEETGILLQELEKLIVYVGEKKRIELQDCQAISSLYNSSTIWELGEAFFNKDVLKASLKARTLIDNGYTFYAILAALRSQLKTLMEMTTIYQQRGEQGLIKSFPYLKGAVLSKKVAEIQKREQADLKMALYFLFDMELKSRKLSSDPLLLLELTITKYATFSAS